jgi:hypothetical protein
VVQADLRQVIRPVTLAFQKWVVLVLVLVEVLHQPPYLVEQVLELLGRDFLEDRRILKIPVEAAARAAQVRIPQDLMVLMVVQEYLIVLVEFLLFMLEEVSAVPPSRLDLLVDHLLLDVFQTRLDWADLGESAALPSISPAYLEDQEV